MHRLSAVAFATASALTITQFAFGTSSFAADVAAPVLKAPPPPPPSWTGFYLGVTGGYGWKHDNFTRTAVLAAPLAPMTIDGIDSRGGVVGGYAGYNWQFGRFVTGLEVDFTATDISGTSTISQTASTVVPVALTESITQSLGERVKYLGSVRARLGWLPIDTVLVYGTAGLAWERVDQTDSLIISVQSAAPGIAGSSTSWQQLAFDKFGWVAGVGVEAMLGNPNWIGRLEYLHYGMALLQEPFVSSTGSAITAGSQNIDIIRGGLAYKFGESRAWTAASANASVNATTASWTGFYIGAHGGYGWGNNSFIIPVITPSSAELPPISGETLRGWLAGAQIGYNWQFGSFVTGLEFDLSAADIKGTSTTSAGLTGPGTTESFHQEDHVKYLGTVRGRLGWTPLNTVLLYGTGGLAWERLQRNQFNTLVDATHSEAFEGVGLTNHFGWVAGAGVEAMLGSPNWIGRLEYLHYDFGRVDDQFSLVTTGSFVSSSAASAGRHTINTVRGGVSYKFGPQMAAVPSSPLYTKAPKLQPAPPQAWTGFYIGAHGGYGWKDNDFAFDFGSSGTLGGITSSGFVAGGQAGYNWQYGNIVGGAEVDGSATGIKGTALPLITATGSQILSDNVKYLGTVRGRLGWTPINNVLLYGTGGLAWERANRTQVLNSIFGSSVFETPRDHFGWAAGAGAEFMLGSSNWIARIEYLHYDFGQVEFSGTFTSTVPGQSGGDDGGRQTINVARAAVSYKFAP
jgi:opacity protein-like surface antigen